MTVFKINLVHFAPRHIDIRSPSNHHNSAHWLLRTFAPDKWGVCGRAGRSERTTLLPFLYQAPLLAFHPATWAPLLWAGSYFSSGNHLLKTDFGKPYCPGTALSINQTAEMPLLTLGIHYPSKLPVYLHSVSLTSGTGRGCQQTIYTSYTLNLQWKHRHKHWHLHFHLPSTTSLL